MLNKKPAQCKKVGSKRLNMSIFAKVGHMFANFFIADGPSPSIGREPLSSLTSYGYMLTTVQPLCIAKLHAWKPLQRAEHPEASGGRGLAFDPRTPRRSTSRRTWARRSSYPIFMGSFVRKNRKMNAIPALESMNRQISSSDAE